MGEERAVWPVLVWLALLMAWLVVVPVLLVVAARAGSPLDSSAEAAHRAAQAHLLRTWATELALVLPLTGILIAAIVHQPVGLGVLLGLAFVVSITVIGWDNVGRTKLPPTPSPVLGSHRCVTYSGGTNTCPGG